MAKLLRKAGGAIDNANDTMDELQQAIAEARQLIAAIRDGVTLALVKTGDDSPLELLTKPGPATLNIQLKVIINDKPSASSGD